MTLEEKIVELLTNKKETISFMESCTGGYCANKITNVIGASNVINFSCVTYSNEYKIKMNVKKEIIEKYSVYSFETSNIMAKEISLFANSTYGVGITGTINRIDENNLVKENNIVYVTIYNSNTNNYINIKIKCPDKKREECKEYIVNTIFKELSKIIGE